MLNYIYKGREQVIFKYKGVEYIGLAGNCGQALGLFDHEQYNATDGKLRPITITPLAEDFYITAKDVEVGIIQLNAILKDKLNNVIEMEKTGVNQHQQREFCYSCAA